MYVSRHEHFTNHDFTISLNRLYQRVGKDVFRPIIVKILMRGRKTINVTLLCTKKITLFSISLGKVELTETDF